MDFIHGTAFFLSTRFSRRGPEKEVGELSALLIDIRLHAVYGKITVAVTEGAIGQKNKEKWKEQQDAKNNERRVEAILLEQCRGKAFAVCQIEQEEVSGRDGGGHRNGGGDQFAENLTGNLQKYM